jgi:outer membrane autotransporter protein
MAAGASLTTAGIISGGNGGSGGAGASLDLGTYGGNGGNGGAGVNLGTTGGTLTNAGTISGGNGGSGGGDGINGTVGSPGAGGAGVVGAGLTIINSGLISGGLSADGVTRANPITFTGGTNTLVLQLGSVITGNVVAFSSADTLALGGSGQAGFDVSQIGRQYQNFGAFQKVDSGTWVLGNSTLLTTNWAINGGTLGILGDGGLGTPNGTLSFNGGTLLAVNSLSSARTITLNAGGGTFNPTGPNGGTTLSLTGPISGPGALTLNGPGGTLILSGANTYTGGTSIIAGTLQLGSAGAFPSGGTLTVNGGTFALNNFSVTSDALSGTGGTVALGTGTLFTNSKASTTLASAITGTGTLVKLGSGVLTLSGNASGFTGNTIVSDGGLVVNGSLGAAVVVNHGTLGGNGTVRGLTINGGVVGPGNSIGTLNVTDAVVKSGGAYQFEANGQGQGDRINVGGRATINGATVQLVTAPGPYANSTTYTILNAAGGVSGAYAGVTDNLAFLTPTLSYDANNVYLTLALQGNAFSQAGATANQRAAGTALDRTYATATGDLATVIGAIAGVDSTLAPQILNSISGQPYADFGTVNVAGAASFMNVLGQQMALARGGAGSGQRQSLAQACEATSCDPASPFTSWLTALGGIGSLQGNGNAATLTYNMGGVAAGLDYRLDPRVLMGIGVGYATGTNWVNGFAGVGFTDSISVSAYASFTQGAFYADALAGYAYANNQLQRQIVLPLLQPRVASGSTGANQFLGQIETGYKVPVFAPAQASITPFARLQAVSVTQNAFGESGASSLSLNVAQQTTNSLRSTLGVDLAGAIGLGEQRQLDLALRLGWMHEYAYTGRPITAAFAGAPAAPFTVYGATSPRDYAVIGLSAGTRIAEATEAYLRYDGAIGAGNDSHALTAGFRIRW